jgi:hypothetical protein
MQLYQRSAFPLYSADQILTCAIRRKKAVSHQTSELEALEARLRATEERLKKVASASPQNKYSSGRSSPRQRVPLGDTFTSSSTKAEMSTSPLATEFKNTSRPNSGRPQTGEDRRPVSGWKHEAQSSYTAQPVPGALPPTPGASEGESSDSDYVVVGGVRNSADIGEDGDTPPPPPQKDSYREEV